jgi:two-component system sensor histidine kinase DesK
MGSAYVNPAGTAPQRLLRAPLIAPRLARSVVAVVFTSFCFVAFLRILYAPENTAHIMVSLSCMIALLALQLLYFTRPSERITPPVGYLALMAQAALVYLPLLYFKQNWVGLPGFLAGSALLVLSPVPAWILFGSVVASIGIIQAALTDLTLDIIYACVSTVITGLVVYGLTRLASLVVDLHAARNDLARLAVAQERLRFARDLHDLLGYSLSAITLKSELTRRLVLANPEKAEEELAEVLDISRRGLAGVRPLASRYPQQ